MREILFRGKRIDNGEWVEGYYLVAAGMSFISAFAIRNPIHVDSETVGQYTGLTDKNGKRIFEGGYCRGALPLCMVSQKRCGGHRQHPRQSRTVEGGTHMNYDITFCSYAGCPFKDCEKHLRNLKQPYPKGYVSVSDFGSVCRRYIGYLADELSKDEPMWLKELPKEG